MLAFLGLPENTIFVVAILLMMLIGIIQAIGLDGTVDLDAEVDANGPGGALSWLGIGRLPLLLVMVVFLAAFGSIGLVGQQLALDLAGSVLSPWFAAPAAAAAAIPATSLTTRLLARILPRDQTTAVPLEVLIGGTAQIVVGRALSGAPARARAEDQFGQAHYVMVEPDNPGQSFAEGEHVLLVRREGDVFRAIARGDHHLPGLGLS